MTKRIVSLFLVLCLLVSTFCVTSSAVYEIEDDTTVVPLMLNTGISVAAVEPSDLDDYLLYAGNSVAYYLAYILYSLTGSLTSMRTSVYTYLDSIDDQLLDQYSLLGSMSSYMSNISSNSNLIRISLDAIEDDVSIFESRLNSVISSLVSVNTSVGTVNTSVLSAKSVLDVILSRVETAANVAQLDSNGSINSSLAASGIDDVVRRGFLGIAAHLRVPYDVEFLNSDGNAAVITKTSGVTFQYVFNRGLLGLRSLLSGSETDNIYTLTLYDNNNTTSTVNSTGLGPLLNTQLSNIGENLGHLAYMFASDDDIKLKLDSQPLLDEADSFFDESLDSNVKVSADNIGSLKNYVGEASDILDTGTDADDFFSVVSNQNSWLWFSAESAADLNTVPMTVSELDVDFYHSDFSENLYAEFYATYFPDR